MVTQNFCPYFFFFYMSIDNQYQCLLLLHFSHITSNHFYRQTTFAITPFFFSLLLFVFISIHFLCMCVDQTIDMWRHLLTNFMWFSHFVAMHRHRISHIHRYILCSRYVPCTTQKIAVIRLDYGCQNET